MNIVYREFVLSISSTAGDQLHIGVDSPEGEGSETISLPAEFRSAVTSPGSGHRGEGRGYGRFRDLFSADREVPIPDARHLGDLLFRTFFQGQIRQLYDRSAGSLSDPSLGLRIKIRFDGEDPQAGALSELPWELLYQKETKDFLGRRHRTPIVRYVHVPRATDLPPFEPPLRVLLVASKPIDQEPLDLEDERRLIEEECRATGREVKVDALESADDEKLRDELFGGGYHVVHFMGHGAFDETRGEGCLLFETEDHLSRRLLGEDVAELFKDHLPRLVIINACESGRAGGGKAGDFFHGVATALVMAGTPAVLAMRKPISDDAAIAFSKRLYRLLVANEPIDVAAAEARFAIYRADRESFEWATPVLFMRVADGRILSAQSGSLSDSALDSDFDSPTHLETDVTVTARDSRTKNAKVTGKDGTKSSSSPTRVVANLERMEISEDLIITGESDGSSR